MLITTAQMTATHIPFKKKICLRDLSNYRELDMPDSPEKASINVMSPINSLQGSNDTPRPQSASSTISGMNSHSPHSSMTETGTPSPPSMGNSVSTQQLPPACGARQLSKLKRFLTTLQQFGSDISPEIGERVRTLVLGLVNSHLSIEEFHTKLQEATNFPLRPFVIPFLKANLPLLQRELLHCARMAKQSPQQYLRTNDHILFNATQLPMEPQEIVGAELNENGKRKLSPDSTKENGTEHHSPESSVPLKRHQSLSPGSNPRISPAYANTHISPNSGPMRLEDISLSRELREREKLERERIERDGRERHYSGISTPRSESLDHHLDRIDDDWKHVEYMLNCVMGMVEKTKRALAVLQERSTRDREELSIWMRRHAEGVDHDVKKRTNEMMAHTLRSTEDRVIEVKRRAEEAVNEVKRQAVHELQKAVAAAESKANELINSERVKMERGVCEARKKAQSEAMALVNTQQEGTECCWNCGRKASETCSGCNVARYCGSFCQHKDWENHHSVCGQQNPNSRGNAPKPQQTHHKVSVMTSKADTAATADKTQITINSGSTENPTNQTRSRSSTPTENNKTNTLKKEANRNV